MKFLSLELIRRSACNLFVTYSLASQALRTHSSVSTTKSWTNLSGCRHCYHTDVKSTSASDQHIMSLLQTNILYSVNILHYSPSSRPKIKAFVKLPSWPDLESAESDSQILPFL